MKMKLADALLRRKELNEKVDSLRKINVPHLFEQRVKRVKVSDGIDEVIADVPKITLAEVTAEFDHYASQLRKLDSVIQQANWTTEIEADDKACSAFVAPTK